MIFSVINNKKAIKITLILREVTDSDCLRIGRSPQVRSSKPIVFKAPRPSTSNNNVKFPVFDIAYRTSHQPTMSHSFVSRVHEE